jgi:hypothetical protein
MMGESEEQGQEQKKILDKIDNIDEIFLSILKEHTAGSPMDEKVKWTNLSYVDISKRFKERGLDVSEFIVKQLLKKHGYSERQMRKTMTMKQAKNRNEQFERIQELKDEYTLNQNPIISVDVKKKEQIGNFYRDGKAYCLNATVVYDHDFKSFSEGVVIPHGVYDLKQNVGYITLGNSKDTSEFNCECIKDWWVNHGKSLYPFATSILLLVDGGGSNSSRHYIFKEDLQKLTDYIGVEIRVAHYPPYTSKYNPIEHRLFCHVSRACEGVVFSSIQIVKELVDKTSTSTGLKVFTTIKDKVFKTARKAANDFKENMTILFDDFLGQWNYRAVPTK